jgi:3-hydroxy-9,10-secoandrosta-1,3,5(10)-triene-9,17-dione monooxygenase reductase component
MDPVDTENGRFTDDFLFYLVSRAHFQTSRPTREKLAKLGSSMEEYLTLAVLSMEAPLTRDQIGERLNHTGHAPAPRLLDYMERRGLIRTTGTDKAFDLDEKGRKLFIETLAHGKAFEADLTDHFTAAELAETKRVLRRIIDLSGRDVPIGWRSS